MNITEYYDTEDNCKLKTLIEYSDGSVYVYTGVPSKIVDGLRKVARLLSERGQSPHEVIATVLSGYACIKVK